MGFSFTLNLKRFCCLNLGIEKLIIHYKCYNWGKVSSLQNALIVQNQLQNL